MARQSLQASEAGVQQIKKALRKNKQSQTWLAGRLNCSRQTIWSLLNGKAIDYDFFIQACSELNLNWEEIAQPDLPEPEPPAVDKVAILVQSARSQARPLIREQCGTMRVLDMTQPIALTGEQGIYTNVNILERLTGRQRIELSDLLKQCDTEDFERFGLSRMTEQRVPGLEAAQRYPKMMVLGKPGAGKTTFLKYLAMQCIEGNFLPDHLPIFVTLKAFAEEESRPSLLNHLGGEAVTLILASGKALILLDGLDEVREEDTKRVIRQIEDLSKQYPDNHLVITCRIAAKDYTFGQFTEVEVADFNDAQIDTFAHNWFRAKGDAERAKLFREKLDENEPIKELASSPILLTLLCLMFEDTVSFPANRSELYKEALDVLLKKWDGKRKIERDAVYKNLSLKRKEDLLSQIALTTFERKEYFFKQRNLEDSISEFICNLPDAKTDLEALHLDSEAVLKSIEAHHGLLVERAKGIYSFSHLTFHEYFAAREIVESRDPETLKRFVRNVTDKRWQEVFLLTAGMMRNADELVLLMKQEIDQLLAEDDQLQELLTWVQQKSASVDAPHKLVAIRACYLALSLALTVDQDLNLIFDKELEQPLRIAAIDYNFLNDYDYRHDLSLVCVLAFAFKLTHTNTPEFEHGRMLVRMIDYALSWPLSSERRPNSSLKIKLQQLQAQLIDALQIHQANFDQWWKESGEVWTEQSQAAMIKYRNIGHKWKFKQEQKDLLEEYDIVNNILINCLNSDCYISREVREEIEATLLLPISEIEKYHRERKS